MVFLLCAVICGAAVVLLLSTAVGNRKLLRLEQVTEEGELYEDEVSLPLLSVIIPARNEEEQIARTLRSLLEQDYPDLEIVAINDRSTDTTGAILQELAKSFECLTVLEIKELPEGWIGKNYAMHLGALHAQGKYLLFSDADVDFAPSTLLRAMHYALREQLDHLTMLFRNSAPGGLLNASIVEAMTGLLLVLQPWRVKEAGSKFFIGVGAFNLLKREVYETIGGHRANPMHPVDDVILGKIVKEQGYKQDCLRGEHFLSVAWYADVREMINGLMKNVFAFYNYSLVLFFIAVGLITGLSILPQWGALLFEGWAQIFCIVTLICKFLAFRINVRAMEVDKSAYLFFLCAPYILLYISIKATVSTLQNKGIVWRGTKYSLGALRESTPVITLKWLMKR